MKFIKGDTNAYGVPIEPDTVIYEVEDWLEYLLGRPYAELLDLVDYYVPKNIIADILDDEVPDRVKLEEMNGY